MSSNATAAPRPGFGMKHAAVVAAALWLVALGATLSLATGAARQGLLAGLVAGAVGSALGMVLLGVELAKPVLKPVDLMRAQVLGFLGRLLLVAGGLVFAMRTGGDPLAFALGFFALFFGVSALETAVVFGRREPVQPASGPDGSRTDV